MSPKLHAGGEVDSYCTKCRMVLNHRIIAMVGTAPKRVECSTCSSHHNFRARAPGDKAEPAAKSGGSAAARSSGGSSPRPARQSHLTKAQEAQAERERSWEKSIAGRALADFKPYRVSSTFSEGDLIRHAKFGEGVVTRIVDTRKIEILFRDEPRMLAQGLTE